MPFYVVKNKGLNREMRRKMKKANPNNAYNAGYVAGADKVEKMTFEACAYQMLIVLHDEFGFGKKRLEKFMEKLKSQSECVNKGLIKRKELQEIVKGFGIEFSD